MPAIIAVQGCVAIAAGAAGAGAAAYVNGALKSTVEASVRETAQASKAAVKELDFKLISEQVDAVSGQVVARTAQDKKIMFKLKEKTAELTELSIRVGAFGDEDLSRRIHRRVRDNL